MTGLIGLLGKAGAGKDSVAAELAVHGWHRVAFADPIRAALYDLNPAVGVHHTDVMLVSEIVDELGWESAKRDHPELRHWLRNLGESVREHVGPGAWIGPAMSKVHAAHASGTPVVVTDVRRTNEAARIQLAGGRLWRIERPGITTDGHVSETELDDYPVDRTIVNESSLDDLRAKVLDALAPQQAA